MLCAIIFTFVTVVQSVCDCDSTHRCPCHQYQCPPTHITASQRLRSAPQRVSANLVRRRVPSSRLWPTLQLYTSSSLATVVSSRLCLVPSRSASPGIPAALALVSLAGSCLPSSATLCHPMPRLQTHAFPSATYVTPPRVARRLHNEESTPRDWSDMCRDHAEIASALWPSPSRSSSESRRPWLRSTRGSRP